jgi:hypothetical protein
MTNLDDLHLEKITDAFTRALLLFPMKDIAKYKELSHRIANLISFEVKANVEHEQNLDLMQYWTEQTKN